MYMYIVHMCGTYLSTETIFLINPHHLIEHNCPAHNQSLIFNETRRLVTFIYIIYNLQYGLQYIYLSEFRWGTICHLFDVRLSMCFVVVSYRIEINKWLPTYLLPWWHIVSNYAKGVHEGRRLCLIGSKMITICDPSNIIKNIQT